ncbi:MAG: ribosome hibernation-promoting factor, HPF/YfiA family [Eubacterium sp.]
MKYNITGKNFKTYRRLEEQIEKKFDRLDKYFSEDITANIVLSHERGKDKIEVTINAQGALFRAEEVTDDVYEGIDLAVDKLTSQIKRFKGKLQKRYQNNKALKFEFLEEEPEEEAEEEEQMKIVREKKFDLRPMDVEEAILEMEMLEHDFFVFLNSDTETVNVVYRRKGGKYGLLEPQY